MTGYTVGRVAVGSWAELAALDLDHWVWLDMEPGGVHRAANLPPNQPAQVSHVWGWAAGRWIAARVDPHLPRGIVASELRQDGGQLAIAPMRTALWSQKDARVSLGSATGFHAADGTPDMQALVYRAPLTAASTDGELLVSLDFLELVPPEPDS